MATLQLIIPDMACNACVETITQAVQTLDQSASVTADTQTKQLTVTTTAAQAVVKEAIAAAGYTIAAS